MRTRMRLFTALVVAALMSGLFLLSSAVGRMAAETGVGSVPEVRMIESAADGARYWPRWRGPSGQGAPPIVADGAEGNYPDRWSTSENVIWTVPVPGQGNSSPVVWGDRIFVTTAYEEGRRRSILCYRRSDGELLWETFAPRAEPEDAHRKNGLASSTPTTDGERIYAFLGNHGLLAVDFEGETVWHRRLGDFEAYHGTAASPLLYGDRIVLAQDHRGGGGSFIAAYDRESGDELWRTARRAEVGWSTPIAIRVDDHDEIVLSGQREVVAYDPSDGRELWRVAGNTFEAIPTPVVGQGLLFCTSGRGGPTIAIRPGGSGDVTRTHVVWKSPRGASFVPSPVLAGEYLLMVNDMSSIATGYRAATGEALWQGRLGRVQRESFSSSPVVVDGKAFFTNDEGTTFVLAVGPEFELLHVNELGERILASPALVDGRWYFRTASSLMAIGYPPVG